MMQRRSKVFEKYTQLSSLQQQFRSWRAWTGILAVAAVVSFFVTQDWKWRLGLSASAIGFAYQAFVCYNKWKNALQDVERSKLMTSSQEFGKDRTSSAEAVVQNASLSSKSNADSSSSSSSATSSSSFSNKNNNNIISSHSVSSAQRTPSESSSLRRRNMLRANADVMHSPDHNPENFSPALARKYAQQVMQSPDPMSPMMAATSSSKSVSLNDNRFSAFPTTPSMDPGYQERKQYHVSPLVTDTVKRSVNSAEPRRSNALHALGITSIPDEWIEKLKGNLGAHLYAILKLHDQSVQVIKAFLKKEEEKGAIPKGSYAKVTPLLDHEVTYKKVQLDNGSFLTIDGILEYCGRPVAPVAAAPAPTTTFALSMTAMMKPAQPPQPGVPEDILQKYKAASSFFDLCRRIQEVITQRRFPEDEGSSAANTNALAMLGIFGGALSPQAAGGSSSSSSSSNRRTSLMERLRQLQSSDRKLRIEWQSMSFARGGGGGGFGFGGRSNTRDFIAGHQDMEMMDQDIVVALFLHRCNDHQTRIISASTSPPPTFSDMHVVAHAEDMSNVLQRRHKELSATFDHVSRGGGGGGTTNGSGRFGGASSASPAMSATASREASALLNMLLRNYPQPEDEANGTGATFGSGGGATGSSSSSAAASFSAAAAGRSMSPHYDLLRMATQVPQASQMSQASWQQMSSMLAAQLSHGGGGGGGGGGSGAPMFLSFFPQYKEIWTVDSGRNDIFEVILLSLILMTLTAPPNDLEDETARSNSVGDDDDVLSQVSSSHHHHHHHSHHNQALAHIVSHLEGNSYRKQMSSSSSSSAAASSSSSSSVHDDGRAAVMATLRRVFKLKGMGSGVAADARVVRGLFDEVIDVHELRHLMYEYHNLQLLQQQSQQQVQQQQQLYAAGVTTTGGVGASSSMPSSSLALGGMGGGGGGGGGATGLLFGSSSRGLSGGMGGVGAGDARSPFSPSATGSHSRSTQSLNLLLGGGSSVGVHEPMSTSMMDHSPFGGGGFESTGAAASATTPFRHMSGSVGIGGAGGGGGYTPLSPLYSPPLFGRGAGAGAGAGGAMGPPPAVSMSTGFSPLGAAMTPITPGGGVGAGGGGGSALRGFNASFSTDMSFGGGTGTAEKRYTPFALR